VYEQESFVDAHGKECIVRKQRSRLGLGLGRQFEQQLAGVAVAYEQAARSDADGAEGAGAAGDVAPPAIFVAANACVRCAWHRPADNDKPFPIPAFRRAAQDPRRRRG